MVTIIPIWTVWTTVDEYGRRGTVVGHYASPLAAEPVARGKGWYGSRGSVETGHAIYADGQYYWLVSREPITLDVNLLKQREDIRKAALAKLSDEEKKVLGVKS
jgi:hypothetical protein